MLARGGVPCKASSWPLQRARSSASLRQSQMLRKQNGNCGRRRHSCGWRLRGRDSRGWYANGTRLSLRVSRCRCASCTRGLLGHWMERSSGLLGASLTNCGWSVARTGCFGRRWSSNASSSRGLQAKRRCSSHGSAGSHGWTRPRLTARTSSECVVPMTLAATSLKSNGSCFRASWRSSTAVALLSNLCASRTATFRSVVPEVWPLGTPVTSLTLPSNFVWLVTRYFLPCPWRLSEPSARAHFALGWPVACVMPRRSPSQGGFHGRPATIRPACRGTTFAISSAVSSQSLRRLCPRCLRWRVHGGVARRFSARRRSASRFRSRCRH
mmetsp:Transcript_16959/g.46300  ORF Transcript_16959/g.46300 Transcript_16959/m.46300 type:complete len:326 (-) Transcript_16959:96-1073(-)